MTVASVHSFAQLAEQLRGVLVLTSLEHRGFGPLGESSFQARS